MKLNVLFVIAVFAIFAVSQGKSVKKASTRITKTKPDKTAKHKDAKKPVHNAKPAAKKSATKTKNHKDTSKVISKPSNKTEQKAVMRTIPDDCNALVEEYTNGRLLMAEYQAKMGKCLKNKDQGVTAENHGGVSKKAETPASEQNSVKLEETSEKTDDTQQLEPMYVAETGRNSEKDYNDAQQSEQKSDELNQAEIKPVLPPEAKSETETFDDASDDVESEDDDDDDYYDDGFVRAAAKKMDVPSPSDYMTAPGQPGLPSQQTTNVYPNQAPQVEAPAPNQVQAEFAPSTFNSYQAPAQPVQDTMNAVARNEVPDMTQVQAPSMAANTAQNQWGSDTQKKDETPGASVDQQFAQFMQTQTPETAQAVPGVQMPSQQAVGTADAQQRSNIQASWPNPAALDQQTPAVQGPDVQQRSDIQTFDPQNASAFSAPATPQASFMAPMKRDAPEEGGNFPESP